jgi:hypothetical protein
MKIEIRNVKVAMFASEETHCFEATIYIDGVKATRVSNEGHGGPNRYDDYKVERRIDEWAKTLPPLSMAEFGIDEPLAQSAETIIGDLVNKHLEHKQLARLCKTKVLFRIPNKTYKDGEYNTLKAKYSPEVKAYIVKKYGDGVVFLNETILEAK